MASTPESLVSIATLRFELRLDGNTEVDMTLARLRDSAISRIAEYTGLPLIDQNIKVRGFPDGARPVRIGKVKYPIEVVRVQYWTDQDDLDLPPPASNDLISEDTMTLPDGIEVWNSYSMDKYPVWYVVPGTPGWPNNARMLLFTLKVGLSPSNYEHIPQAIILLVREMFEGHPMAGKNPAWKDLLVDSIDIAGE